jgi:hypothetical protein
VLVKPRYSQPLEVVEGERSCALDRMQKYVFDTDILELTGTTYDYPSIQYKDRNASEIEGYVVEVFVNGTRVAADIQPADTKRQIDQVKADKEKGQGEQKRKRF